MKRALTLAVLLGLSACSQPQFPGEEQYGPDPKLPEPQQYLIPPMGIAAPVGFKPNETPSVPAGFAIAAFARDLHGPRRVLPLPDGDALVVESDGPGLDPVLRPKSIAFGLAIGKAHSPVKAGNRVLLLRDSNHDGVADQRIVLIDKLNSPFGIAVVGNKLYVAATDALWEYPFAPGATVVGPGRILTAILVTYSAA